MTLFVTSFCSISLIFPLNCLFNKIFIRSKVVQRDPRNTLTKSFFDTMSHFWLMTSIVTSFCSISLICLLNRHFERLNPIWHGLFMYVKGMGGGKITPQSKTFKNDAKKLKVSHKLETLRNFPKYQKNLLPSIFFDDVSTFVGQKIQKITNLS